MLSKCFEHAKVHVRFEWFLIFAIEDVRPRFQMNRDIILNDDLLGKNWYGLFQINVGTRQTRFADDFRSFRSVLVRAYVEVHRHLHFELPIITARCDIRENLVIGNGDDVVIERIHSHAAQANLDDVAIFTAIRDTIADLKGSVEHDRDPRNERCYEITQCKTNSKREGTTNDGERCGIETNAEGDCDCNRCDINEKPRRRLHLLNRGSPIRKARAHAIADVFNEPNDEERPDDHGNRCSNPGPANEFRKPAEIGRILSPSRRFTPKRDGRRRKRTDSKSFRFRHDITSKWRRSKIRITGRIQLQEICTRPPSS